MLWESIVDSYSKNPRDVQTVPSRGEGLWFYASCKDSKLFISRAQKRSPSSQVQGLRTLNKNKCDVMYSLYQRRKQGESVSAEAKKISWNPSYWYGIFKEMGL